jgi:hypothetical protein
MQAFDYIIVMIQHQSRELTISTGEGAPRDVPGGYFNPARVFNDLGAEGWALATSVHERIGDSDGGETRQYTLHMFQRPRG